MRKSPRTNVSVAAVCSILLLSIILVEGSLTVQAASSNFGYAVVGDSNSATFGGVYVTNFTSPPNLGNITQIIVYLATGGTFAKAVIYSDNNGTPESLLAESSEVSQTGTSGTWVSFNVSYTGTPNTVYWLGIIFLNAGSYYYGAGVSEKAIYSAPLSSTLSLFPSGNATQNSELSIYAIYTPSTSSTPEPSDQTTDWIQAILFWIVIAGLIIAAIVTAIVATAKKRGKK